jgi:hypothetical protein
MTLVNGLVDDLLVRSLSRTARLWARTVLA